VEVQQRGGKRPGIENTADIELDRGAPGSKSAEQARVRKQRHQAKMVGDCVKGRTDWGGSKGNRCGSPGWRERKKESDGTKDKGPGKLRLGGGGAGLNPKNKGNATRGWTTKERRWRTIVPFTLPGWVFKSTRKKFARDEEEHALLLGMGQGCVPNSSKGEGKLLKKALVQKYPVKKTLA